MFHRTNDLAAASGVYHSNCRCRTELRVRTGDRFPVCGTCRKPAEWSFHRSVHADPPPPPPSDDRGPGGT